MKYVSVLLLLLTGCTMPNEEIIRETKKCHDAGMRAVAVINGMTMRTMDIECRGVGKKGDV